MGNTQSGWRHGVKRTRRRSRFITLEQLDARHMMAGDLLDAAQAMDVPTSPVSADVEPQYEIKHPPRLQLGDAALAGTPAFDGHDQVEIIWQTISAGIGTEDAFVVDYRKVGAGQWSTADLNATIDTNVATRVMHSATIQGLDWSTDYEYRVQHIRAGAIIGNYQSRFETRATVGDQGPFSFAAYGDSNSLAIIEDVNALQARLVERDPEFALLLGDNIYGTGSHTDADVRFDPLITPESVQWNSQKIDYLAIGNHDTSTEDGKPSQELFSVPVPVFGTNSNAQLPDGELEEFTYSFDYGDAHFVTFDGNVTDIGFPFNLDKPNERVDGFIDFMEADLAASDARWKIVFVHHPIIGTDKFKMPTDYYFQQMISRLADDVDLLMVGHSHTFSWTYPIHGFSDADESGKISFDEIEFTSDPDHVYEKGSGLIQLVAGVGGLGGNDLRPAEYGESIFALGYSDHEETPQDVVGFALVDVTQRSLKVSYISAATGGIVGDTNENGMRDEDEPHFGQFEIVDSAVTDPDVNQDGVLNDLDIDTLALAIRNESNEAKFDLNQDTKVNRDDVDFLLTTYLDTTAGDANLDRVFDSGDLVQVFRVGEYEDAVALNSTWSDGDWDGDGDFTTSDLVAAFEAGAYVSAAIPAAFPATGEIAAAVDTLFDLDEKTTRRRSR